MKDLHFCHLRWGLDPHVLFFLKTLACRLSPRIDCTGGGSYTQLTQNILAGIPSRLASRECYPYKSGADGGCDAADARCPSQLPPGESVSGFEDGC
jgi:hypothetical protein